MSARPTVALVGAGGIATLHAAAAQAMDVDLVAVAEPQGEARERLAAAYAIEHRFPSLTVMLSAMAPDLVVVATPSHTHAALAAEAILAGRHVLVEIPMGMSAQEVDGVRRAADARPGVVVAVAHTLRHWEPYRMVKDMLRDDPVVHLQMRSLQRRVTNVDWQGRERSWADSVVWHHGTHLVDTALWLMDESAPAVHATRDRRVSQPMFASALLESGRATAELAMSYLSRRPKSDLVLVTDQHTYEIDGATLHRDDEILFDADTVAVQGEAVVHQLADVLQALRGGSSPSVGLDDAANAARVIEEIAGAGRPPGPEEEGEAG